MLFDNCITSGVYTMNYKGLGRQCSWFETEENHEISVRLLVSGLIFELGSSQVHYLFSDGRDTVNHVHVL
jgi:hypothetical protein